ncbi:MAG: DNA methyltransferase [Nanoarchaeota archaeon]
MLDINNIFWGDCFDKMQDIDNESIDLIILDPPYNINADYWDNVSKYYQWMAQVLNHSLRVLKSNGSLYLWGTSKNNDFLKLKIWLDETQKKVVFKNWIVWIHDVKIHRKLKDRFLTKHEDLLFYSGDRAIFNPIRDRPPEQQLKIFKGKYDNNFFVEQSKLPPSQQKIFKNGLQLGSPAKSWWKGPANQSNGKIIKHAGYKSEWVCERIINVSSNKNSLVLIPFAGSGTECFCCKKLNRNFIGIEKEKEYIDIAKARINKI